MRRGEETNFKCMSQLILNVIKFLLTTFQRDSAED